MRSIRSLAAILVAVLQSAALATPYQPQQPVSGDIRIWGSPEDGALIALWNDDFHKHHPNALVTASLHGPDSAMAGIYTGVAELAFVGRELRLPVESMAFEWVKLHKPATVEVANASLTAPRVAANLAVFVHPSNPLVGLSLQQLDAIFGGEHKRGGANVRTWGDLGLVGEWRERPIRVLGPAVDSVPALFFRKVVLKDSFKWNPALQEANEAEGLAALASDPAAIAYAPMAAGRSSDVKALPLAASGTDFVALTAQSAADRSYPLARAVHIAFDRAPGKPVDPRVREFLRYVLSDEGQAAVARDGAYVPLQAASAQRQLKGLD